MITDNQLYPVEQMLSPSDQVEAYLESIYGQVLNDRAEEVTVKVKPLLYGRVSLLNDQADADNYLNVDTKKSKHISTDMQR